MHYFGYLGVWYPTKMIDCHSLTFSSIGVHGLNGGTIILVLITYVVDITEMVDKPHLDTKVIV